MRVLALLAVLAPGLAMAKHMPRGKAPAAASPRSAAPSTPAPSRAAVEQADDDERPGSRQIKK